MTAPRKRRRGRPPAEIRQVIWEGEDDPDAEELLLQALEMLLPASERKGRKNSREPDTPEQLRLF